MVSSNAEPKYQKRAFAVFRKALENNPNNYFANLYDALILEKQQKYKEAVQRLNYLIKVCLEKNFLIKNNKIKNNKIKNIN